MEFEIFVLKVRWREDFHEYVILLGVDDYELSGDEYCFFGVENVHVSSNSRHLAVAYCFCSRNVR